VSPRGNPGVPKSREHIGKLVAGGVRHGKIRRRRTAALAAGHDVGGEGGQLRVQNAGVDISPAAFRSIRDHIGDCEYMSDGVDEEIIHALERGVVYASSACGHHEPPFQELTIEVIAAVERAARKNGYRKRRLPGTPLKEVKTKKLIPRRTPLIRAGKPLTAVVEEMFPAGAGRPLLAVVSEMFDS